MNAEKIRIKKSDPQKINVKINNINNILNLKPPEKSQHDEKQLQEKKERNYAIEEFRRMLEGKDNQIDDEVKQVLENENQIIQDKSQLKMQTLFKFCEKNDNIMINRVLFFLKHPYLLEQEIEHQEYIKNDENLTEQDSYLKIGEIDDNVRLEQYFDNYWFLQKRIDFLIWIQNIRNNCLFISQSNFFEFLCLITIIINSITLALDNPTQQTQTATQETFELFFLVFYTIEAVTKILGMGYYIYQQNINA